MKFATLSIMDHHPALGRSVPAFHKEMLIQIEAAEALGFHAVWFAELQEKELIIVGGPECCIRLIKCLESWGARRLLAILNDGGLPHDLVLRSMERLARMVMPAFTNVGEDPCLGRI